MTRALERLAELDAAPVVLEVAASNAEGLALYESYGFERDDEIAVYRLPA
jgi:ribosomal protein S18 acetylase RimI-like enzyme